MMMVMGAGALAYSAMVALCQGLKRHQLAVWGKPWSDRWLRALRIYGWLGLLLSLWLSAEHWGWAMGSVGAFGLVSVAGWVLVLGLPYWPRTLVTAGAAAGLLGFAALSYNLLF